ncbi:TcpQ domain-containing protein [Kerstersia sp.]|uniref:TcpQ domain-containing protein n=1 Tax=Kerstersia sp. TaxID=1930783 RepID=UPI003F930BFF
MRTQRTLRGLPLGVPAILAPLCLGACVAPVRPPLPADPWPGVVAPGRYDFSWRLSGQRELAPLQVFDDGNNTWLQFPPQQTLPAIFVADASGERLAAYETAGPYLRVRGVWPSLVFRGGSRQARAQYAGSARAQTLEDAGLSMAAQPVAASVMDAAAPSLAQAGEGHQPISAPGVAFMPALAPAAGISGGAAPLGLSATEERYTAGTSDGNMRRVLGQWAQRAGWTFDPWHWDVSMDVPLAGNAEFGSDFMQAVRQLLAATELSGQPLQPCFYNNRVLRVVAWTQPCDRHAQPGGGAA